MKAWPFLDTSALPRNGERLDFVPSVDGDEPDPRPFEDVRC